MAFYPGPAGATESELDLDAWSGIGGADAALGMLADDVEALLVRVPDARSDATAASAIWSPSTPATSSSADCECCGEASTVASEVREFVDEFFERIKARSKVASSMSGLTRAADVHRPGRGSPNRSRSRRD